MISTLTKSRNGTRTYRFGPGRNESLVLTVRVGHVSRPDERRRFDAILSGSVRIYNEVGEESVDVELRESAWEGATAAECHERLIEAAYEGDENAAYDLASFLAEWALDEI